jgi:hypothetical protein
MSDAALKRVEELILAAAPAYETYLLQVMGKPFYLKTPLFKTTPERFRVTFESVEQPALGTKKPERIVMWVELNRSMGTSTVSCEYWQNLDDAEPTARSEAQVDVTPENLMAPAFALGWLHKLVSGGNESIEGDDMSNIEEQRMERAELLIVKADSLLAELGYTIEATSYESYADTLDNFLLHERLDPQVEGILKKIGNVVRKAAHAYGAVKGGVKGASDRWKGFKKSVGAAYSKGHEKGYKAATGKDDDDEAPAHEPKASGGKHKLKLVKGGGGEGGGRKGGKMSDKEYKARYGHPRKTIAASLDTPTNDLEEMMDGLRGDYYEAEFQSLGIEELLALEELVELMHEGNLDEKAKLGSGGRFAALVKKLKMKEDGDGVKDPAALAAWIGRKKYGKEKFQKMAAAGRKEAREEGGVHGNWGGTPSSETAVSSYQRLSGLVTPMQGWSLPKLK